MNAGNKVSSPRGRGRSPKKTERLNPEEALNQLLEDHKKSIGDVVSVRIDARTSIELPAAMSPEDRQKRVDNYIKNMNFKPVK